MVIRQLVVVILNYRTSSLTIDCLSSMENEIDDNITVLVVDNDSGDGSYEQIEQIITQNNWENWCRLIPSPANDGFAAGNNIGIQYVDADAYILLNSDTIIRPGAFAALLDSLENNPDVGLAAPGMETVDGDIEQNTFRDVTPIYEFMRAANTRPITSLLHKYDVVLKPSGKPFHPQWVGFACVIVRKEVIDQVGLLDEGFFMYFEDIDYCKRVREKGWKVLYWPNARVIHLLGGSSGVTKTSNVRRRPPKYYYEARAYYFKKHFGISGLVLANAFWVVGRCVSFLRETVGKKIPMHREHELQDIWIGLFR